MKFGKTAAYTILKNELRYIDKWLYYTRFYDYRVLLDTGSTDGSWERLQEAARQDPNLIIEQRTFTPWRFDVARRYNHAMIPQDVVWALSPDMDEYFSINTLSEMERVIEAMPSVTNIACDRLDIYSSVVRVGPPDFIPTNKIHLRADYTWVQPIYEHLSWIHKDRSENEQYHPNIYLIHDQDFQKEERPELYIKMLREEYAANPTNTWCLWFLIYHFYKSRNIHEYIPAACIYLRHHHDHNEKKYTDLVTDLTNIYRHERSITDQERDMIHATLVSIGKLQDEKVTPFPLGSTTFW